MPCAECNAQIADLRTGLCFSCLIRKAKKIMGGGCAAIPADVRNPPKVDKSTGNLNAKLVRRKGSKRIPGEKKIQRIVKTYQVKSDGIACVLCGALIQKGKMLEHKAKVHGEREITPSVTPTRQRNVWVQILQGGLPGLGKRR